MEGKVPQQQRREQWPGRGTAAMTMHTGGRLPGVRAQQRRPTRGCHLRQRGGRAWEAGAGEDRVENWQ
eukprot:2772702-Prymnesium_polylepis.1